MATASHSLATALWRARFASGLLRPSYTTSLDTTNIGEEAWVAPDFHETRNAVCAAAAYAWHLHVLIDATSRDI
jgi:hypothetical protein